MVASGDRHYVFVPIWAPGPPEEQIILKRQELGGHDKFRFRMCENLPESSKFSGEDLVSGAVLLCKPRIVPGDKIAIDINGHAIAAENINYKWQDEEDKPPLCSFALTSPPAVYGDNHLGLTLITSAADADDDIILDEVEVIVKTGD